MTDIVERLGVLAASLANPQIAVDAQQEIKRLRHLLREARNKMQYMVDNGEWYAPVETIERIRATLGDSQ